LEHRKRLWINGSLANCRKPEGVIGQNGLLK